MNFIEVVLWDWKFFSKLVDVCKKRNCGIWESICLEWISLEYWVLIFFNR